MDNKEEFQQNLFFHWVKNLVGTSNSFTINLILTLFFGSLYSFKVIPFPFMLIIFGVVSPVIFTICLYNSILNSKGLAGLDTFPKAFLSRSGNTLMMSFDILLIIGFALLINADILNNFFFRFLQTVFFPALLLIILRIIYIGETNNRFGDDFYNENSN